MAKGDRIVLGEDDRIKVTIDPRPETGEVFDVKDVAGRFSVSRWSDDPGTGIAVLLPDGRELLNPLPMAPPIGYVEEPSVMELIQRQVQAHMALLRGELEIDTEEEKDDFDVMDDIDPFSVYEIDYMKEDFPGAPPGVKKVEEKVEEEVEEKVVEAKPPGSEVKS